MARSVYRGRVTTVQAACSVQKGGGHVAGRDGNGIAKKSNGERILILLLVVVIFKINFFGLYLYFFFVKI